MNRRLLSWAGGVFSIILIAVFAFINFGSENDKRTGTTEDDDESTIVTVDREAPTKPDDQPALPSEPETQPSTILGKSSEPDFDKQNNEDVSGTQPAVGSVSSPQAAAAGNSDRATDNVLVTRLPTSPVADVDTTGVNLTVTPEHASVSVERASDLETIAGSRTLAAASLDEGNRPSDNKPTTSSPEDLGTSLGVAASGSDDSPGGIVIPLSRPRRDVDLGAGGLLEETSSISAPSLPESDIEEPNLLSAANALPQTLDIIGVAPESASETENAGVLVPMPKPRSVRERQNSSEPTRTSSDPELAQPGALQAETANQEQQSAIAALPEVPRTQETEVTASEPRVGQSSSAVNDTTRSDPERAVEIAALNSQASDPNSELPGPGSSPAIPVVPAEDEVRANTSGSAEDRGSATERATEPETSEGSPTFDIVRVDQDGQTVIAGTARPNTKVEVLLDGVVVGGAMSDGTGQFVAVVFADLSETAQRLQLRSLLPVGEGPGQGLNSEIAPRVASNIQDLSNPVIDGDNTSAASATSNSEIARDSSAKSATRTVAAPEQLDRVAAPIPSIQRHTVSAPVIILPAQQAESAPTLVQPRPEGLAMLQPAEREILGVVLDSISYDDSGAVILSGRGVVERVIRIYANGKEAGIARVDPDGRWVWASEVADPQNIKLFRMDELGPEGSVTSRIETPFKYERSAPKLVREREVEIQRGDMLWRIAEQYYGEGIRFSMIFSANSELIRDPDLIYPGQVFTIPELVDAN